MVMHFLHMCQHGWTRLWHTLHIRFDDPVRGNPLHEAWDQHGDPLPRISPEELAHASGFGRGVHARGV